MLGLDGGIKRLSNLNIQLSFVLLAFMVIAGPTLYIFDSFVENMGNYINEFVYFSFWSEAYSGTNWQVDWTIFYWAWWISWSPFVGIFIARISRGRTVREFTLGVLFVPATIMFFWFTAFGGVAIQMELGGRSGTDRVTQEAYGNAIFRLVEFYPLTEIVTGLLIVMIVMWFVTSSDSASFVIDMLTAGGEADPPKMQRLFWADQRRRDRGRAAAGRRAIGAAGGGGRGGLPLRLRHPGDDVRALCAASRATISCSTATSSGTPPRRRPKPICRRPMPARTLYPVRRRSPPATDDAKKAGRKARLFPWRGSAEAYDALRAVSSQPSTVSRFSSIHAAACASTSSSPSFIARSARRCRRAARWPRPAARARPGSRPGTPSWRPARCRWPGSRACTDRRRSPRRLRSVAASARSVMSSGRFDFRHLDPDDVLAGDQFVDGPVRRPGVEQDRLARLIGGDRIGHRGGIAGLDRVDVVAQIIGVHVMLDVDLAAPAGRAGDEVGLAVAIAVEGCLHLVALEVFQRGDAEFLGRRRVDEIAFERAALGNRTDDLGAPSKVGS